MAEVTRRNIIAEAIAEERTTLPEGATLSVARVTRPKIGACNELRAWFKNNIVKMRADNITPQNLRWYLDRIVAAINRERAKLTSKPSMLLRNPKTIPEFVNNMAFYGMFILDPVDENHNPETGHCVEVTEPEKPKKARRRKAKKHQVVTVPTNGTNPV